MVNIGQFIKDVSGKVKHNVKSLKLAKDTRNVEKAFALKEKRLALQESNKKQRLLYQEQKKYDQELEKQNKYSGQSKEFKKKDRLELYKFKF